VKQLFVGQACRLKNHVAASAAFLRMRSGPELEGLVVLELYGDVALLRSLAVVPARRGAGLGSIWLSTRTLCARSWGEISYLLTMTAESLFLHGVCPDHGGCTRRHQGHKEFADLSGEFRVHGQEALSQPLDAHNRKIRAFSIRTSRKVRAFTSISLAFCITAPILGLLDQPTSALPQAFESLIAISGEIPNGHRRG